MAFGKPQPTAIVRTPEVVYCINPDCHRRINSGDRDNCQFCNTPLVVQDRFRLLEPIRPLDFPASTEIFEVEDRLGSPKIMKVLKSDLPELVEALDREAIVLQILRHPSIPKVEEGGYFRFAPNQSPRELHCLVMEKFAGPTLQEWLGNNNLLSERLANDWLRQMAIILDTLHRANFFHQDIKPANIILRPDGRLGLIDFGAVGVVDTNQLRAVGSGFESDDAAEIALMGTIGYIAPEQGKGKAVPQSDFYALGCTFVHLMTGVAPYRLPGDPKTKALIWRNRAPQISREFADLIDELMAEFPGDRPKNTQILLRSIVRLQQRKRLYKSPIFWVSAMAGIALLALYFDRGTNYLVTQDNFEQAKFHLLRNEFELARFYLEPYIRQNLQDADAYTHLALACQKMQDYKCAKDNYQKALKQKDLELNRDTWKIHYNLGSLYDAQANYGAAESEYRKSIQPNGSLSVPALNNLARLMNLQGNYGEAEKLVEQGLPQTDDLQDQAAFLKNRGWAELGQGLYQKANTDLQRSKVLDPQRLDTSCLLAQVQEAQNNSAGAKKFWKNCLGGDSALPEVQRWQDNKLQRLLER